MSKYLLECALEYAQDTVPAVYEIAVGAQELEQSDILTRAIRVSVSKAKGGCMDAVRELVHIASIIRIGDELAKATVCADAQR